MGFDPQLARFLKVAALVCFFCVCYLLLSHPVQRTDDTVAPTANVYRELGIEPAAGQ